MKKIAFGVAAAALTGLPLMAAAQADPADPGAAAPPLVHPSAFSDYRPWQDIKPADWRVVNDTVRDAKPGGASTGQGAAPASPPPGTPAHAAPRPVAAPPVADPSRAAPQAPSGRAGHGAHQ